MNLSPRFDNFYEFGVKNISDFLIWDYIDYMNAGGYDGVKNYLSANFQTAAKRYKKYRFILKFIDGIYNSIVFLVDNSLKFKKRKKVLFFMGDKYGSIILAAREKYDVEMIVGGIKDRLFAIKHFIKYSSCSSLNQLIFDYLRKKDEFYLRELVNRIKKKIEKINPNFIALWNDCLPIERSVVMVAKILGIITFEVQHGSFDSFSLETGKVANYALVWGKYFKDLQTKHNLRKPEDVYILGYPFLIGKQKKDKKKNGNRVVYYLGQNFELQNKKFFDTKIETIKKISEICRKLGMKFIYRPHPGDDIATLKMKLPEIRFCSKKEKIHDSISKGDVFISFNSTSLIEAAIRSKISLQLMNFPIKLDNFKQLGVCNESFKTMDELEGYLARISASKDLNVFNIKFNNNYIETRYNSGKRFLEILEEVKNKK